MAKTFIRVTCPVCGSMPYPGQVEKLKYGYSVRVFEMTVGGKVASTGDPGDYHKKGKGSAKGSIVYKDVTDEHPEIVADMNKLFALHAVGFAEEAGFLKK